MIRFTKERKIVFGTGDNADEKKCSALTPVEFKDNITTYSPIYNLYNIKKVALMVEAIKTDSPTNITLFLEYSPNQGVDWYTYNAAAFLTITASLKVCYEISTPGSYVRFKAVSTGCDDTNYFTLSSWVMLINEYKI